jgi:hypothetical protein
MTISQSNLKNIYENITEGSVIAFYHDEWYWQLIPFFTREKKAERVPHHIAICYEIVRKNNTVLFKVSEQNFRGGKYRPVVIHRSLTNTYYTPDKYFKKQDLITLHKVNMNAEQVKLGIADAREQIGKRYGYFKLIFAAEFLEKILPKRFFKWLNKKKDLRICSTHISYNLQKAGFTLPKDDFLSPLEIIKLNIYF